MRSTGGQRQSECDAVIGGTDFSRRLLSRRWRCGRGEQARLRRRPPYQLLERRPLRSAGLSTESSLAPVNTKLIPRNRFTARQPCCQRRVDFSGPATQVESVIARLDDLHFPVPVADQSLTNEALIPSSFPLLVVPVVGIETQTGRARSADSDWNLLVKLARDLCPPRLIGPSKLRHDIRMCISQIEALLRGPP